jgi:hypothetical protein
MKLNEYIHWRPRNFSLDEDKDFEITFILAYSTSFMKQHANKRNGKSILEDSTENAHNIY